MPSFWDGNGSVVRTNGITTGSQTWGQRTGTPITVTEHDHHDEGLADSIQECLHLDGQNSPTGNISWANNRITNLAIGTAATDAASVQQIRDMAGIWCGTSGGGANAYTLSPSPSVAAYADGQTFMFFPVADSTGAVTVDVSGLGAKAVFGATGSALVGGEMSASSISIITYDGTQFVLVNGIAANKAFRGRADGVQVRYADDGSSVGPDLQLFRNSSNPADNDLAGKISFLARNDAAETIEYGLIRVRLDDVSDGTEDATLQFNSIVAGSPPSTPILQISTRAIVTASGTAPLELHRETSSGVIVLINVNGSERARLTTSGNNNLGITPTVGGSAPSTPTLEMSGADTTLNGALVVATTINTSDGNIVANRDSATPLVANRNGNDGTVISIRQATTEEGTIAVTGSTVSYNGFTGSHYADWADPNLVTSPPPMGTFLETTDAEFVVPGPNINHEGLCYLGVARAESRRVAGVYLCDFHDDEGNRLGILVSAIGGPVMARFSGPAEGGAFVEVGSDGVARMQADETITTRTCGKIWRGDGETGERLVSIVLNCG